MDAASESSASVDVSTKVGIGVCGVDHEPVVIHLRIFVLMLAFPYAWCLKGRAHSMYAITKL